MSEEEKQRFNIERAIKAHDNNRADIEKAQRFAVESANVAIRAFLLINGGATVALLAFVGAIWTAEADGELMSALVPSLQFFAFGVGFAGVAAALAYLVNMLDANITCSVEYSWDYPHVRATPHAKWLRRVRYFFHISALILAVATLAAFFGGVLSFSNAIQSIG
jgi:hypothetical protein